MYLLQNVLFKMYFDPRGHRDMLEILSALFTLLYIHLPSNFPGPLRVRMREKKKSKEKYFSILNYFVKSCTV